MTFFQNPFQNEFRSNLVLSDRQYSITHFVLANSGRTDRSVTVWSEPTYDLSGNDTDSNSTDTLVIKYSFRNNWSTLSVDVTATATSSAAVTAAEIATDLNADPVFSTFFEASSDQKFKSGKPRLEIKQLKPVEEFKFFVVNGRAEEVLLFNKHAGISEIPSYFARHTVDNAIARTFSDGQGAIIELDPSGSNVDAAVIDNAVDVYGVSLGLDSSSVREDWQLLEGKTGLFQFTKGPSGEAVDSTSDEIIYMAGASVGDFALKVITQYDATSEVVAKFEIPYVLTSGDMITPP